MSRRSEKYGRGGYVFLQETGNKTRRLKRMSLTSFKQAIIEKSGMDSLEMKEISSPIHSEQRPEEMYSLYGKTLILQKLTPTEKEKLQGMPQNWTLCEESSLEMRFQSQLPNGSGKESFKSKAKSVEK